MNSKIRLFIGLMYSDKKIYNKAVNELIKIFGDIEEKKLTYDFDFTDYYEPEMGKNLIKTIILFKNLINKEDLTNLKITTAKIEDKFRSDNKRGINIDPGYLSKDGLVLASFKGSAYKEDLGKGVYAHFILKFKNNKCETLHRTFPDFKEKKIQDFFLNIIKKL